MKHITDIYYAKKDVDSSFQQMVLQRARDYFNAKAIELEKAPTMEISDY